MKRLLPALAVLAIVLAGAFYAMPRGDGLPPLAAGAQDAEVDTSIVQEMAIGAEDAPIEVIEYASFTCPHCARFHQSVFPNLKADYIDTGLVRFVSREVYFDRYGLWAGMVARCDPMRYFGVVDMIYDRQSEWTNGDPAAVADNLRRIGLTAGLDGEQLDQCLSDGAKAQALVAVYEENAARDGIRSTPSFLIDGELESNMSEAEFRVLLDEKLES